MLRFAVERRAAAPAEVDAALVRLDRAAGIYFGCDAGVAGLHPRQATLVVAPAVAVEVFQDRVEVAALDAFGAALLAHPALIGFRRSLGQRGDGAAIDSLRRLLAAFRPDDGAPGARGSCGEAIGNSVTRSEADVHPPADAGSPADASLAAEMDSTADADPPAAAARSADSHELADADAAADALLVGAFRFEAHRLAGPSHAVLSTDRPPLGVLFFAPASLRRDAAGVWQHVQLRFDDPALAAVDRDDAPSTAVLPGTTAAAAPAGVTESDPFDESVRVDRASGRDIEPHDDFPPGGYATVVARAVERLAAQPLVSLTLSQSFRRRVGAASAAAAFRTLRRANPAPATFFVNTGRGERVFGASPDLQLRVRARTVESFPVCGTVARGHGPVGEAESFRQLINEDVDAASLAVCTDALRNDLAPLCQPGSLHLTDRRRPMALATVVHTVDRFAGRLRDGVDAWDAIVATAAPVMVTGTPRRLALAAIADLEVGPRGWYGGLAVQVAANGDALVGTILRAAAIRDGIAEVRTGGDLLADSEPAREEHESRVKAVSLWRALGLTVADALQASIAGGTDGSNARGAAGATTSSGSLESGRRLPAAVALRDAGDPFTAALRDALQACGVGLDEAARPTVLIGSDAAACADELRRAKGLVAIGDAAARVLGGMGWTVRSIRPEHGRLVRCVPTTAAPVGVPARPFVAMRYATLALDPSPHAGRADAGAWQVWVRDVDEAPLVLADTRRRIVCLLIRPESLLSDPSALEVLKAALVFAAEPAGA